MNSAAGTPPTIIFACVHNSGRSVAAKVLAEHYAAGQVQVRSAGSQPGSGVNSTVARVLAERGLSTDAETPTMLDTDAVRASDVVVTMGCGETCPVFPGKRYEDWTVDDPSGQDLETVRRIVDEIERRVRELLAGLAPADAPLSPMSWPASPAAVARARPTSAHPHGGTSG
jgi:arsenate reductase